jgi:predicted small secreted protein
MKKIFLFLAVSAMTLSLTSCNKDDGGGNSITLKVDGVSKSFSTIAATESNGTVLVVAYNGPAQSPTDQITISMDTADTGTDAANVTYSNSTNDYFESNTFTTNVSKNAGKNVVGTFSGPMTPFTGTTNIVVTEGKFNVSY